MVTDLYAHVLDEDRKVNAQKFEAAFYASPDMRDVEKRVSKSSQPQESALNLQQLVTELQQNPAMAELFASLLKVK